MALAVVGAAVPVGLHSLPGRDPGRDSVTIPATRSQTTTPTSRPTNEPTSAPTSAPSSAPGTGQSAAPSASTRVTAPYPSLEAVVSDCGLGSYAVRPATMTLTCGDGGIVATHLVWTSWGAMAAEATGTARVRDCRPSCAAGSTSSVPIRLFVTSSKASDPGQRTTPSDAPVISVFDHATMTFTGNTPPGWSGPPVSDYPLDVGPFSPDQLAAATVLSTFWDPNIAPTAKTAMVAGGADIGAVRLVLSTLPADDQVTVTAATISGGTATVTWHPSQQGSQPSTTWSLSRLGGRWLIDEQAWNDVVAHSRVAHGTG